MINCSKISYIKIITLLYLKFISHRHCTTIIHHQSHQSHEKWELFLQSLSNRKLFSILSFSKSYR